MRNRLACVGAFSALFTLGSIVPLGCSSEPTRDRGGAGGTSGTTGLCTRATENSCEFQVSDGPSGSGSECLAFRDNAGQDRIQLRQAWTRLKQPVGSTLDAVYGSLLVRSTLRIPGCFEQGVSGYVKLLDFDLSAADPTQHTLRIGWANWVTDPVAATQDGLCFVSLDYTDPKHDLTETWHVEPVVARRVADDFDVATLATPVPAGEGIFYYNEATGETHVYQPKAFVVLFDNDTKLIAVPIYEVEERGVFNDPTAPNCMGRHRSDALRADQKCFSTDQNNPPWGCDDSTACAPGDGPVNVTGYFKIEEIEKVYTTILHATLCVTYQGQQNAIDAGWANADAAIINCKSGTNTFDPTLADDAGLPNGDWCSETNSPATATCHDAFRSVATSVYAAFPIQDGICPTAAGAGI